MSAPCILTIEDDPAIRRGIVDSLKATGHVVWQADQADTGIEKALSKPCDLVLLDLVLPGGHGCLGCKKVSCVSNSNLFVC